jgi:glycogen debranching enzyme
MTPLSAGSEVPFYIPSTSAPMRPRRTLKFGDAFAVLDAQGDIGMSAGGPDGLFFHDTRYLTRLELSICGRQPLLLGSTVLDDNVALIVDLTNPDQYQDGQLVLPKDTIHIVRSILLWNGAAYERLALGNYGDEPAGFTLGFSYDSDFADLFEVRGQERAKRGMALPPEINGDGIVLGYRGLDQVDRRTLITFEPAPRRLDRYSAQFDFHLEPGRRQALYVAIGCDEPPLKGRSGFYASLRRSRRARHHATRSVASVETSNDVFNEILCRAMADLYMLVTNTPEGPYPYAGIPWYSTTFGRDGILTALLMLWVDPNVARGVLRRLAHLQAREVDPAADAEPGKILHEMRGGEMATLGEVPFQLYYGSIDSTPLFVLLAGAYFDRTGDLDLMRELWPSIAAALDWIERYGDTDGDGFVEYRRAAETGLANQGWKDSWDSVFHADGALADGPIALCEVQGYVFAAWRAAARIARALGDGGRAEALERQAAELAERFEDAFWCEEIGTYAIALDGDKRPCRVRSSNAGQVLFSGIARPDRAERVADQLLTPAFFSGWGIRTIAMGEARYNPMSYHNGSIWPHDNAMIALGLARYGLTGQVDRVFRALFDAAGYMDLRRLPELYCGFRRRRGRGPTLYPVACAPQAWASAAMFGLIHASLGMEFSPGEREVRFRLPRLPAFLDELTIRGLKVNGSEFDVAIKRHEAEVAVSAASRDGAGRALVIL